MSLEATNNHGKQLDDEDESSLLETLRDFANWIYEGIRDDYDYRMTDEYVDDAIKANEYTFLENGKRED